MANCRESDTKIRAVADQLLSAGLNLLSVLDRASLVAVPAAGKWGSVILIGNSGAHMWRQMPAAYRDRKNPVDEYAYDTVHAAMAEYLPEREWQILFPDGDHSTDECPPLQQLGALAGWHHPSPLGTGINNKSGLWFAYRAVVGVVSELTPSDIAETESPCVSCVDQPCVQACPAAAIDYRKMPDMRACATYRLQPQSPCADSCLARLACPIAVNNQYSKAQLAHHYRRSLPSLRAWLESAG